MVAPLRIEFGITYTPKGCVVWRQTPRHRSQKRFLDTIYCQAISKARDWVATELDWLRNETTLSGRQFEIVVPEELMSKREWVTIVQATAKWDKYRSAARDAGLALSDWVGEACDAFITADAAGAAASFVIRV